MPFEILGGRIVIFFPHLQACAVCVLLIGISNDRMGVESGILFSYNSSAYGLAAASSLPAAERVQFLYQLPYGFAAVTDKPSGVRQRENINEILKS